MWPKYLVAHFVLHSDTKASNSIEYTKPNIAMNKYAEQKIFYPCLHGAPYICLFAELKKLLQT